jgi:hypothetical protein
MPQVSQVPNRYAEITSHQVQPKPQAVARLYSQVTHNTFHQRVGLCRARANTAVREERHRCLCTLP